jgi:hypothetical protein
VVDAEDKLIGALTDGDVGAWFDKGSLIDSFSR